MSMFETAATAMAAACKHTRTTAGQTLGYSWSVAVPPYTAENRAAHGGITFTEECDDCGARRKVNQNQRHVEVSPWGESRAVRAQRAEIAREKANDQMAEAERAIAAVEPLIVTHESGRTATVSIDAEGMLVVEGAEWSEVKTALSRSAWLDQAKVARQAVVEARRAIEAVEQP